MTCSAWTLGAPVTEPGGNVARSSAASPWPGASRRATSETRCQTPECGCSLGRDRRVDAAVLGDAPEVVAHQVDDHHVLGAVLRGVAQRRRVAAGAVPLIGPVVTSRPARRRNSSGERLAIAAPRRDEARAVGRLQLRRGVRRTARRRRRAHAASSRRQRLAWKISPAAIRSTQSATAATCPAAPGARSENVGRRRAARGAGARGEQRAQALRAARRRRATRTTTGRAASSRRTWS